MVRHEHDLQFQELQAKPDRLRRIQTPTVYDKRTKTIGELAPEQKTTANISSLRLDDDDIIVSLAIGWDGKAAYVHNVYIRNANGHLSIVGITGG